MTNDQAEKLIWILMTIVGGFIFLPLLAVIVLHLFSAIAWRKVWHFLREECHF